MKELSEFSRTNNWCFIGTLHQKKSVDADRGVSLHHIRIGFEPSYHEAEHTLQRSVRNKMMAWLNLYL